MGVKIFIYCRRNVRGEIENIPFLDYIHTNYNSTKEQDLKKIINIKEHILHIARNGARYNQPPYAEQYHGRTIGVLKIKEGERLVRIAFYAKINDTMIILSAKDKPKLYEKGLKKFVDKEIEQWLNEAEQYLKTIKNNPKSLVPFSI